MTKCEIEKASAKLRETAKELVTIAHTRCDNFGELTATLGMACYSTLATVSGTVRKGITTDPSLSEQKRHSLLAGNDQMVALARQLQFFLGTSPYFKEEE